MLVIIKSPPGSKGAADGMKLARDEAADIVLLEEGAYLAEEGRLEGFCGTAHALEEDLNKRGIKDIEKGVRKLTRRELDELISSEQIIGEF